MDRHATPFPSGLARIVIKTARRTGGGKGQGGRKHGTKIAIVLSQSKYPNTQKNRGDPMKAGDAFVIGMFVGCILTIIGFILAS